MFPSQAQNFTLFVTVSFTKIILKISNIKEDEISFT
ncbi:hypothetical protein X975_03110, partial [Stegodyphus mimosarum]